MSDCGDIRNDLVALGHGELDGAREAAVRAHLTTCDACRAEETALSGTLALVRSGLELEPSASSSDHLMAALDQALNETPAEPAAPVLELPVRSRLRDAWEYAQWRYTNSRPVRRFVAASLIAHAAAIAFLTWVIVDDALLRRQLDVTWDTAEVESLESLPRHGPETMPDRPNTDAETAEGELDTDFGDPWQPASDVGVQPGSRFGGPTASQGSELRFPTVSIMFRYRSLFDEPDRQEQLREFAGEHAAGTLTGIDNALAWLSSRRRDDGTWGPEDDATLRPGITGAVVLAFLSGGHSAEAGESAPLLDPAVKALETWLASDTPPLTTEKRIYSYSLAVRALALQYSLDFQHLGAEARSARRDLLARAGRRLVAWQSEDGGFGYKQRDPRTDASCTLFAGAALADLRAAGVLDTRPALRQAGTYLAAHQRAGGTVDYRLARDRDGDLALTAGFLALRREFGRVGVARPALARVEQAIATLRSPDALLLAAATEALRRNGRRIDAPIRALLAGQRPNGSWPAERDRHLRVGGDETATAFAVLGLSNAYVRPH